MDFKTKKTNIINYICKIMNALEPSKINSTRYRKFLEQMSQKDFTNYMKNLKDEKDQVYLVAPNLEINMKIEDIQKAAELTKTKLFSKVWLIDPETKKRYLTNREYPILQLPVRRMEQFLDHKLRVPNDDKTIDGLTGQVTGDDAMRSFSAQESRVMHGRGLDKTLIEILKIRGGDVDTYGEFKRQLEETGSCDTSTITSATRVKSAHSLNVFLKGMLIDNNF